MDRCKICDRPECRDIELAGVRAAAVHDLLAARSDLYYKFKGRPDSPEHKALVEHCEAAEKVYAAAVEVHVTAERECHANFVDWRGRALRAEAALRGGA